MAATRPNLTLDEQSFQGLLAAAFTIQQYNDRKKTDSSAFADKGASSKSEVCRNCMAAFPAGSGTCPACGAETFRPGERLQRTWAAMWSMSQEQGLWPEPSTNTDAPPPSSGNGNHRANFHGSDKAFIAEFESDEAKTTAEVISDPDDYSAIRNRPSDTLSLRSSNNLLASAEIDSPGEAYLDSQPSIAQATFPGDEYLGADAPVTLPDKTSPARRSLADLRLKISFQRADLYLGIAVLVAAVALLWPTAAAQRPHLRPWERMLIAMGIAEAPQPPLHYRGDPNIRVWVDTHTALYYCPGEELYGKSEDGHYGTQHEAQLDRFEPAERIACQ
jgi:ribosomal protein L40E